MKLFKKNENKETVKLPMSGTVKKGFRFYCVAVMATALVVGHICDRLCSKRPSYRSQ